MNILNSKVTNNIQSIDFKEISNNSTINIAVLGDPKSGKSSLIECFLEEKIEEKNVETVLNIYQHKIACQKFNLNINIFEISGYFDRDKELIVDYLKNSNIVILCHSLEQDFNEEEFTFWLEQIEKKAESGRNFVYLVGCKYDLKVIQDYQKGLNITNLMFPNRNLASFGERVRTFMNNNIIKDYFMCSSLLNFNVKEIFHSVIRDFIYDKTAEINKKGNLKDTQNCLIF